MIEIPFFSGVSKRPFDKSNVTLSGVSKAPLDKSKIFSGVSKTFDKSISVFNFSECTEGSVISEKT